MRSIVLLLAALPAMAMANEPPPVPEGGINFVIESECEDHETGQKGECYGGYAVDGTFYVVFWQDNVMMFIRKSVGDSYETIWVNDHYNSY